MIISIKHKLVALAGLAAMLAACSGESEQDMPVDPSKRVEATIAVSMPRPSDEEVVSRATTPYSDTDILTADALIFDETGKLIERQHAGSVQRDGDQINITVLFDASPKKRTVHLVANSYFPDNMEDRVDFSPMTEGCPEANVRLLTTRVVDDSNGDVQARMAPPVMWGRLELPNGITANSSIRGIKLLRSCAGIVVRKDENATAENGLSDFEIEGATLDAASPAGYVTPTETVTTAPTGTPSVGRPFGEAGFSSNAAAWMIDGATPMLYAYDRQCSTSSYMSVIVKGRYKGESGYYKVLLLNSSGTPYNIIRNHRYILTVTSVTDRGYADLATAVSSLPCNTLKASIVESDGNYSSSTADQQYLMSINCNAFELFGHYVTTQTNNVEIATIKTTHPITPTVVTADDYAWINNFRMTPVGNNLYSLTADFIADGSDHEGDITVVDDNLQLPVHVIWHYDDVDESASDYYSVNLINPGEVNWYVKVKSGQTTSPWFGLTNFGTPRLVNSESSFYVTEINSRLNPGAWLHVNAGQNNMARLHKSCSNAADDPISSEIVVVRHN